MKALRYYYGKLTKFRFIPIRQNNSIFSGFEEAGKLVTGVVVQVRRKVDRLQIWTSSFDDSESLIFIGKKYKTVLKFEEKHRVLQYQRHSDSLSKQGSTTRAIHQV